MALNEVVSEFRGQSLIVTFNRPDAGNALTADMSNQLFNILKAATSDRGVRAVLLRGAKNKDGIGTFMNGLDLGLYASANFEQGIERHTQLILPFHAAIRELFTMEKPVIAAVDGLASGPGFSFMAASDLVIASKSAIFNAGFAGLALPPNGAASYYLARKIGVTRANEVFMLNDNITANQADKYNIINRIVDDAQLESEALALLDRLAIAPTKALGATKRLVLKAFEQDIGPHMGLEHTYWGASARGFDFRDAVKAVQGSRPAKFTGA